MLTILILAATFAAPSDSTPKPIPRRVSLFAVPVVYYAPETRFAYGAVMSATFRLHRTTKPASTDSATAPKPDGKPSNASVVMAYTQNKQVVLFLPFQVFTNQNRYYLYGEVGYNKYNYNYYGVGQREVPAENYGVDYPRIRLNALRQVRPGLYAGLRYEFENYVITATKPGGELETGTVPGSRGGRMAGAGIGVFYDKRDNIFYPTKGIVADFTYLGHGQGIGSDFRYNRYVADISSYHKLSARTIVAANYVVSITGSGGTAPFNALSFFGGMKRMRGYYEARYRDQNMALLQVESRINVYKRFTAIVFGAVGLLGDNQQVLRPRDPKGSAGLGLRYRINGEGLNIRADYGFGNNSKGLYLTIGEAF